MIRKSRKINKHQRLVTLLIASLIIGVFGAILVSQSRAECAYDPYLMETVCRPDPPADPPTQPNDPPTNNDPPTQPPTTPTQPPPPSPNPALGACSNGFDIAFLVDTSPSVSGNPVEKTRQALIAFIETLKGRPMTYATKLIDSFGFGQNDFTSDTTKATSTVRSATASASKSELWILGAGLNYPRPASQNILVIITDGRLNVTELSYRYGLETFKQAGGRLLIIGVGNIDLDSLKKIAGPTGFSPKINTGNPWTSDIITTDYNNLGSQLLAAANKICGGTGIGNGGEGEGDNGSGNGNTGVNGGGQGGSSATKQTDRSQVVPESSPQGDSQSSDNEPSPFFDGKLYKSGSDPDALGLKEAIRNPSRLFRSPWILVVVFGLGGIAAAGWYGWQYYKKRYR